MLSRIRQSFFSLITKLLLTELFVKRQTGVIIRLSVYNNPSAELLSKTLAAIPHLQQPVLVFHQRWKSLRVLPKQTKRNLIRRRRKVKSQQEFHHLNFYLYLFHHYSCPHTFWGKETTKRKRVSLLKSSKEIAHKETQENFTCELNPHQRLHPWTGRESIGKWLDLDQQSMIKE